MSGIDKITTLNNNMEFTQLTATAKTLIEKTSKAGCVEDANLTNDEEQLASCMGSENFGYALFGGGYINPCEWLTGDDLIKVNDAIDIVDSFRDMVETNHFEV